MRRRWRWLSLNSLAGALLATLPALVPGDPAAAQEAPTAIIVFDNSGSMWGKLEGEKTSKLGLARDAIETALEKLKPGMRTGLVTFGRRRGDCADIEVVARPEAANADRIMTPLEKLNPKGRGPIVQSTREAAKAIGTARPGSVILIHDDPDNCQQDVCAAAADIKRDQPGLRVHVVSIGMKKDDVARIACLPETTGGRHFDAQNAPQLAIFIAEAVQLAGAEGITRPPPAPVPAPRPLAEATQKTVPAKSARHPTPVPAEGRPGLWLSAVLAAGGDLVEAPVSWRVLKSSGGTEATVFEVRAGETRAELAPGAYTVEARVGLVSARQTIEIAADKPTAAVVALNAGEVKLVARAQAGGPAIDQVNYALYADAAANTAASPVPPPLWIGRDPPNAIGLPPGTYRLEAERGFARAQRSLVIIAGAVAEADMVLGAGLLTLRAAAREDGEALANAVFIVSEDDPDAPGGRRELTRSAAGTPDFVLPAGTYTVTTRIGGNEVRDRVAVGAGESVKRTMILGLGKLALNARLEQATGQPPWREPVTFRVLRKDGEAREVARASNSPHSLELPAGSYRVEAQVGAQNARAARDVELQAGRTTQLAFELQAARATLRLAEAMGVSGQADLAWEVRDDAGRLVWRGSQAEPRLVLAPGRYSVRASVKERRAERSIALRIGEARTIEVGPE